MNDAPDQVCDRVGFSGDHSRTLALVQAGSYQVGALNYAVWDSALKAGKIDASKVSVIWETPTYPDYNWTIRAGVDHVWGTGFSNKVKAALLGMSDEKLLKSFPRSKFISAQNQDYQPILDTAKKLGIIRE
jgi:phosphonate transport system substrate-binding protein